MLMELCQDRIQFADKVDSWEEAVMLSATPLLQEGYIKEEYISSIIENVKKNGSYIVIVPGFAMPHSRPEDGALKTGMAFLGLEQPVEFPGGNKIKTLMALAATDADAHMDAMAELADILTDDDKLEQLFQCKDAATVKRILS